MKDKEIEKDLTALTKPIFTGISENLTLIHKGGGGSKCIWLPSRR